MFILPVSCALELGIKDKDPVDCTVNNHMLVIKAAGNSAQVGFGIEEKDRNAPRDNQPSNEVRSI